MKKLLTSFALFVAMVVNTVTHAGVITKDADVGAYWNPIGTDGTYIYANSFVADQSGSVLGLGNWLVGGSSNFRYQVFSSIGGNAANGPDSSSVLAESGVITGQNYAALTFVDGGLINDITSLIGGETYWFAISAVGLGGTGSYAVGAHTQNSDGIVDNGTFWYSNDPNGVNFDGGNLTPEMAFQVSIGANGAAVPEPGSMVLVGLGLLGMALARKRKH